MLTSIKQLASSARAQIYYYTYRCTRNTSKYYVTLRAVGISDRAQPFHLTTLQ